MIQAWARMEVSIRRSLSGGSLTEPSCNQQLSLNSKQKGKMVEVELSYPALPDP